MKSIFTILFLIGFIFGVFILNIIINIKLAAIVLLLIVILFLLFYVYYKKYLIQLLSIIIGIILGGILSYFNNIDIENNKKYIEPYLDNSKYDLVLDVKELSSIGLFKSKYIVKLINIDSVYNDKTIYGQVSIPNNYNLDIGAIIKLKSELSTIDNFGNFDYKNYMLSKGIYFNIDIYSFELIEKKDINSVIYSIGDIRESMLEVINKIYTKNEAIFLGGILLGARESMPSDLKQDFNNSGLTHFIAVSGFNITILIIFFSFLFQYFPIYLRVILISLSIVGFVILVGDTAPVIRASIMGLLAYYILVSGRSINTFLVILISCFLMLLYNPLIINYDVSFQLSFLAVLGIIFTKEYFDRWFGFLPNILAIKDSFTLTLSAMVLSLPIMIFDFGQLSIIAPLANVMVAWTIAPAMLLGFISIIAYYIYPLLGHFIGYFDWVLLKYDILIVRLFGNSEWSLIKIDFGIYKNYFRLLYFILISFLILYFKEEKN